MSAPLDTKGVDSGLVLNRHFTRAGRDPLALAPFEERIIKGKVLRVPSSWGPGGLVKLSQSVTDQPTKDFLIFKAQSLAEDAHKSGLVDEAELVVLIDELSWVIGRGMGWVGEESGMWVGTINLHHFCEPVTQRFDLAGLKQASRCLLIAAAGQAVNSGSPGSFSLGWTNGAGFLLVAGIAYDSSRGVGILGNIAAMVLGQSCQTSSQLAAKRPDLVKEEDKAVVLAGLNQAKSRISELPPTSPVSSSSEGDRWLAQTQELLEDAIKEVQSKGVLGAYPTAPQPCAECEAWLDPLSTLAEAIPTLQRPDLASHPEIRSSLKAMGLAESQRGAVLTALSSGESILAAGVPEAKAPSLKTALGAWSFHPNAQLMMGSAVSPYVAGVLKHKVHLPAGIPDEFAASVMGAAQRFGLSGAEPCIQAAKFEPKPDDAALDIAADSLPEEPVSAQPEAPESLPVPETIQVEPAHDVSAQDSQPLQEAEPVETPVEAEVRVEEDPEPETTELIEEVISPEVEADHAAEEALLPPPLPVAEPISEPPAVPVISPEEAPSDEVAASQPSDGAEGLEEESSEPEAPEVDSPEDQSRVEPEEVVPEALDLETAAVAASEPMEAPEPEQVLTSNEPAESSDVPVDQELAEESFSSPLVTEMAWSRSLQITSQGTSVILHVVRKTLNSPMEASVTAPALTPLNRSLLDSTLASVNLGLSHGVPLADYRKAINQPGLVRDILQTLSELSDL